MMDNLDMNRIPEHIAIIMDGNGRWATERGKERSYGHQAGVDTVRRITSECTRLGVKYLTLYTFSTENWNRPADEVAALMGLVLTSLEDEIFMKNNVRFRVIGDLKRLPQQVQDKLQETMDHTAKNDAMTMVVALSYSSRWEILNATKKMVKEALESGSTYEQIEDKLTEENFEKHLETSFMPDPELLIRTGGELRISNYLLWQIAYSELYFCDTFWPDFNEEDLHKAIASYQNRQRRFGKTEAQVEEEENAIDARFGAGTGLAVLWRCLYRNGLNKSAGSGSTFGEFDYTSGSGWMYSIGGSYYPGQSMSAVRLKDGDVLTLRYTLAYGWDIGGGSDNYGNVVGYCVEGRNGTIDVNHRWETAEDPDGSIRYVCRCCGMVQNCPHVHMTYKDLEDGTHILLCEDCQAAIGDPLPHNWTYAAGDTEDSHVCAECGAAEQHFWKEVEGTNTATCTEPGIRTVRCSVCGMEKEEEAEAKGHTLDNRWNHTALEHYQKCSTCGEEFDRGNHEYTYSEDWDEYECRICHVLHEEICGGALTIQEATCQKIVYHCDSCGYDMTKPGTFDEYHNYVDGICQYCGGEDPNHVPHEHAYHETQRVEPTCTEDGYIQHTCDCGDSYREPLPAGHTWGEWSPAGDGKEVRYCDACGAEDYRTSEEDTYSVQMLFLHWLFPRMH